MSASAQAFIPKGLCSQPVYYICYILLNSPWGFASSFWHLYTQVPLVNLCADKGRHAAFASWEALMGCIPMIIPFHIPKATPSNSKLPIMLEKKNRSPGHIVSFKTNTKFVLWKSYKLQSSTLWVMICLNDTSFDPLGSAQNQCVLMSHCNDLKPSQKEKLSVKGYF